MQLLFQIHCVPLGRPGSPRFHSPFNSISFNFSWIIFNSVVYINHSIKLKRSPHWNDIPLDQCSTRQRNPIKLNVINVSRRQRVDHQYKPHPLFQKEGRKLFFYIEKWDLADRCGRKGASKRKEEAKVDQFDEQLISVFFISRVTTMAMGTNATETSKRVKENGRPIKMAARWLRGETIDDIVSSDSSEEYANTSNRQTNTQKEGQTHRQTAAHFFPLSPPPPPPPLLLLLLLAAIIDRTVIIMALLAPSISLLLSLSLHRNSSGTAALWYCFYWRH